MEECLFLPLPEGMSIDQVQQSESQLTVIVISTSGSAPCPGCGGFSEQIQSRDPRTVSEMLVQKIGIDVFALRLGGRGHRAQRC